MMWNIRPSIPNHLAGAVNPTQNSHVYRRPDTEQPPHITGAAELLELFYIIQHSDIFPKQLLLRGNPTAKSHNNLVLSTLHFPEIIQKLVEFRFQRGFEEVCQTLFAGQVDGQLQQVILLAIQR